MPPLAVATAAPAKRAEAASVTRRALAASTADGEGSSHGEAHQHDALVYLFLAIVTGVAVLQLTTIRFFAHLQVTVVLFTLGVICSVFMEGLGLKDHLDVFGVSYSMWMRIDPHLLLFTLLPALLTGDAMTIDTNVATRVGWQCLYLAGPGVVANALLTAGFLKLYLGWDFLLSLTTGSILCATDPVAVVALLKELCASPTLTVQIQGESLLNDGTSIVLYTVAYNMLKGQTYDAVAVIDYLVKTVCLAVLLGALIGWVFYAWIRVANNKFDHRSGTIQIMLTLCCAYWSFIMAEGVFHWSGVLSCVAAALTLAHNMWPHVTSMESMKVVWHTFEFLGNSVIFFLAGALVGNAMVHIEPMDYIHLVVIYLVLLFFRALFIFGSLPLLRRLGVGEPTITWMDATVMVWGGLRGAVGLALAIMVYDEKAPNADGVPQIDSENAQRVLFFVGGVAFLTTIINATTAPVLVRWLGITSIDEARQVLLLKLHLQLVQFSSWRGHPPEIVDGLRTILNVARGHLLEHKVVRRSTSTFEDSMDDPGPLTSGTTRRLVRRSLQVGDPVLTASFLEARELFKAIPKADLQALGDVPQIIFADEESQALTELVNGAAIDLGLCVATNEIFLALARRNYWKMIDSQELRPGSEEADMLLMSTQVARGRQISLTDFDFLRAQLDKLNGTSSGLGSLSPGTEGRNLASFRKFFLDLADSTMLNVVMAHVIVANGVYALWYLSGNETNDQVQDFVLELTFTCIFAAEFLLLFHRQGCAYFRSYSNLFDFSLVVLGVAGLTVGFNQEAAILRVAKVFRIMRLLRLVRLFHLIQAVWRKLKHQKVSVEVSVHMHKITALMCFFRAQVQSQSDFVRYFGADTDGVIGGNVIDMPEAARCLLQSQRNCFKALLMAVDEERGVDARFVAQVNAVRASRRIAAQLEHFVNEAYEEGVIVASEAEGILHPLRQHLEKCGQLLADSIEGVEQDLSKQLVVHDTESHVGHRWSEVEPKLDEIGIEQINGASGPKDPKPEPQWDLSVVPTHPFAPTGFMDS